MKLALAAALVALASAPALADDPEPAAQPEWSCHGSWRWHDGSYASRFALGIGHGHYEDGNQKSLFARIGLHHGFELEAELQHTAEGGDDLRGGGAALVKAFGHRHLRPYLVAGLGGGRIEPDAGADAHFRYAEAGGGLMLRGHHLALALDLRKGVRTTEPATDAMAVARMTTPADDTHEHTTRGRILALVYF